MAHKKSLVIVISGRVGAGKSYLANLYAIEYAKIGFPDSKITIDRKGNMKDSHGSPVVLHGPNPTSHTEYGVRIFSFADSLKEVCINLLGIDTKLVWGDQKAKNTLTHILWDSLPLSIRWSNAKHRWQNPFTWFSHRSGPMTVREVLQVVGTDWFRTLYPDAHINATKNVIIKGDYGLSIVCDGRFLNETIGFPNSLESDWCVTKTVRLDRKTTDSQHPSETALDHMSPRSYDCFAGADDTKRDYRRMAAKTLKQWLKDAGHCKPKTIK